MKKAIVQLSLFISMALAFLARYFFMSNLEKILFTEKLLSIMGFNAGYYKLEITNTIHTQEGFFQQQVGIIAIIVLICVVPFLLSALLVEIYSLIVIGKDTRLFRQNERTKRANGTSAIVRTIDVAFYLVFAFSSLAILARIPFLQIRSSIILSMATLSTYIALILAHLIIYKIIKNQAFRLGRFIKNRKAWK